jgi:hypothetical protein
MAWSHAPRPSAKTVHDSASIWIAEEFAGVPVLTGIRNLTKGHSERRFTAYPVYPHLCVTIHADASNFQLNR